MADFGLPPLPVFAEYAVPPDWTAIDFVSDLHLSESTPRTLAAIADHLRCTDADAVFILGDLFDVWVGDDARHESFEHRCAAMLAEASSSRVIGFMAGNRDFLLGARMLSDCRITPLADPTVLVAFGQRLLLSHGDALCLSDVAYQQFRQEVRSASWQRDFLSQPLSKRREIANHIRAESQRRKTAQPAGEWFDVDPREAQRWLEAADAKILVHGHTHMPASHAMADGLTRHVLSDWDLDHDAGARAEVMRWQRDGLFRVAPARCA